MSLNNAVGNSCFVPLVVFDVIAAPQRMASSSTVVELQRSENVPETPSAPSSDSLDYAATRSTMCFSIAALPPPILAKNQALAILLLPRRPVN